MLINKHLYIIVLQYNATNMKYNRELFHFCRFASRMTGVTPYKLIWYIRELELYRKTSSDYADFITFIIHEGSITFLYKEVGEMPACRTFGFPFETIGDAYDFFLERYSKDRCYSLRAPKAAMCY